MVRQAHHEALSHRPWLGLTLSLSKGEAVLTDVSRETLDGGRAVHYMTRSSTGSRRP